MSNFSPYPPNMHDMLTFDWEVVREIPVSAILGLSDPEPPKVWSEIAIVLADGTAVVLSIDYDTDQLTAVHRSFGEDELSSWATVGDLQYAVGTPLGWCWVARNYRGYLDGLVLAFGDVLPNSLTPSCMFLGESGISILKIGPAH